MGTKIGSHITNVMIIVLSIFATIVPNRAETLDLFMKGVIPTWPNAYLCTSLTVPDGLAYIYKFEPVANASTVHHMIVYVCDGPAAYGYDNWKCPATCKAGTKESIVYAWAKNAPATVLPPDVGFRIGKNTDKKTLVLQVHYAKVLSAPDYSGVRLHITKESPKNVAGIFFMGSTAFQIPKGYSSYPVDISCSYNQKDILTLFAVRGHTHSLGVVVSGYHNNATGTNAILKVNPQFPQTFYPVESKIIVKPGDNLLARCTYNSTTVTRAVGVGPTGEMCNYYIMYYTDSSAQTTYLQCTGNYLKNLNGSRYPADGSVPLPPNPYLEEVAKGIEHNSTMSQRSVRSVGNQPEASETILMPGAKPKMPDAYICTAYELTEEEYYINKFEALANADTAHHMLLYGCDGEPYSSEDMWPCPAMCRNGPSSILFAWAKNAPPTALPKDVGLRIGSKTSIKTLVLQVHYARTFSDSESPDRSGLKIYTTHDKPKYVAGIFLLLSNSFKIPPHEQLYPVDISCRFNWQTSIFPFAYRTHAHGLGRVLTGYQYNGTYNVIGKGNPQWPQAFYPVQKPIEVKPGDYLTARCTYDSTSMTHPVGVGSTGNDEMCNFYIMFYTDSSVRDPSGECFTNEYPLLTGDHFPKDVSVPLPPNPDLEEVAKGGHHHAGMTSNQQADDNGNSINDTKTYDILMPGAKPSTPDAYLCTAFAVPDDEFYIYKFEALANADTVHHMLVYGCDGETGLKKTVLGCSPMCANRMSTILFAWAKNAPPTVMPKGVGLRAGRRTSVQTIVIQIHYAKAFTDSEAADHSGLRIYTTHQRPQFVAGVYLLSIGFTIPPGVESYPVDISCPYNEENSIFPFAYRTHAHGLGRVITGYQHNGTYHQIGKGNPQWPQAFYPVKDFIELKRGDALAARCTYDSRSMSEPVNVGSTGNDEMCNFYIMFYTDSIVKNPSGICGDNMLPRLTGENFPSDVSVPLPPNPDLEDKAKGVNHHNAMSQSHPLDGNSFSDTNTKEILMPGAKPTTPDAYLCTGFPVTEDEYYIYKFEALANAATAHHMLLYGCDGEPYSEDPIWNCPQMCKNGQSAILFAWAKNAPPTVLPKDVGLRVGKKTSIKTIVLQVHYAKTFEVSEPADHSGLKIYTTMEKPQFVAGIFLLAANRFTIPPGKSSYPVDISCTFSKDKSIFPFAYRTHAHGLGRVITGYQHNGTYHEIGKGNPQWPQAFYPVKDFIEVKPGDALAARCTYDSTSMTKSVGVGSTGNDEMCNFYIMFYTDSSVADPSGSCGYNLLPAITGDNFPSTVSVPLPPNPDLEEVAKGGQHHGGMNQNHQDDVYYNDTKILNILMRGAKPKTPDAYLCTAYPAEDIESYIYKFEAVAEASTAHHMLLFGCDGEEFSKDPIWNCPAMCKSGHQTILFAWAKNAPPTVFPKDVGLRIGSQTIIKTLVLQVHYARTFSDNEPEDHSGLKLYVTQAKQRYVAGIFFLGNSDFTIPSGFPSYPIDVSCRFTKDKSIFPFAYRTHAHGLGRVITGYQYNGSYHQIGKGNPQWPQTFYPVHDKIEVKTGDHLLARCTYDSTSMTQSVKVGSTGNDEMCNFYIMFYTDSSVVDPYGECNSDSVQRLTGDNFPADVSVTLPPNPALEDEAKGVHHQHHGGMAGSEDDVQLSKLVFNASWPEGSVSIGQIGGVATDKNGNIYVFHRGSRSWTSQTFNMDNDFSFQHSPILEDVITVLNSAGRVINHFGSGQYFMPHGISVDNEGNIWLTDVGLHQVFKIERGKTVPSLTLGHRFQHGEGLDYFCKPTDVAVLSNGDFFVSDGYCNSRILKFSKDGTVITYWGKQDSRFGPSAPPVNTFSIPHGITVSEENQLVCVADRENGRIQCFDLEGNFKQVIKHPQFGPRLFALEYCPEHGGLLYAVNGPAFDGPSDFTVQGFTLDIKTGDLLEMWNVPEYMKNPHDVAVDPGSHSIYVGELDPHRIWKFSRLTPTTISHNNLEESTQSPVLDSVSKQVETVSFNETSFTGSADSKTISPSVIIGILLVIPVVLLLIIVLLVRAHQSGKLKCYGHGTKGKIFNLQGFNWNSHKGFDRLSTEESDHEVDPEDMDHKDYLAPQKTKNKA